VIGMGQLMHLINLSLFLVASKGHHPASRQLLIHHHFSQISKKRERKEGVLKLFMPSWLDAEKTMDAMSKRQHQSST
jgi:hypothetical protein